LICQEETEQAQEAKAPGPEDAWGRAAAVEAVVAEAPAAAKAREAPDQALVETAFAQAVERRFRTSRESPVLKKHVPSVERP
jgi:hypothetical protein